MSAKSLHQWLRREIDSWVGQGLISSSQADTLRGKYPVSEPGVSWGIIVFSTIGAVLVGLGVTLLFAYNWDEIPKFGKLAIVFVALGLAHGGGIALSRSTGRFHALGEGLSLLGTMLFGAGIWLVAQIYHIEEHYPNAFMFWSLGAVLLALAMPSTPQAILAAVLLSIWCGTERIGFDSPKYLAPILIAVALGPLAWTRRSLLLLAVIIPAFTVTAVFVLPECGHHGWLIFSTVLNLGALWVGLRFITQSRGSFRDASRVFGIYGWGSFYLALYLLCFPEMGHELLHMRDAVTAWVWTAWIAQLAICGITWGLVVKDRLVGGKPDADEPGFEIYMVPLIVLLVTCGVLFPGTFEGWVLSGPCNLVFLGMAVTMMARGCRRAMSGTVVMGSILLIALVIARYFDLFHDLLLRGVIFLAIGGVLFAEGIMYARAKKQRTGEQ